jgi:hypothetical protein
MRGAICHGRPGFVHARFREMRASGRRVLRFSFLANAAPPALRWAPGAQRSFLRSPGGAPTPPECEPCEGSPAGVIQLAGLAVVAIGFRLVMKR